MTDRELLELAAKAAGMGLWEGSGGAWRDHYPTGLLLTDGRTFWKPHLDDGDRYRLAKKLKMTLDFDMCCVHSGVNIYQWGGAVTEAKAVLIAAAEIGKLSASH